jgi:ferrous iron transport protein B
MTSSLPAACELCPVHNAENLIKLGVDMESWDFVVALAGNPNTGKARFSTP